MRDFTFRSTRTEEIPDLLKFFTPDNLKLFKEFKGRYRKPFDVTLCKLVFWPLNNGEPVTAYWNDLRSHFEPPKFTFHNKMSWEQQQQVDALKAYNRELSREASENGTLPVLTINNILMDTANKLSNETSNSIKTATVELSREFKPHGGLLSRRLYVFDAISDDIVFEFEGAVKFFDGMNTHMELDVEQMTLYTYYITIHPTRKLFKPWRATYEGRSTKKTFYKAGTDTKYVEPVGEIVNGVFPQIQDTAGRDGTIEETVKSMQRSDDKNIDLDAVKEQVQTQAAGLIDAAKKELAFKEEEKQKAKLEADNAMQKKEQEEAMVQEPPIAVDNGVNKPGSGTEYDSRAGYWRDANVFTS